MALRAGLDLGIFTRLGGDAATADSLGAALKVEPDRLSRVLYALASIGLLEVKDGQFRNGAEASAFLDASNHESRLGLRQNHLKCPIVICANRDTCRYEGDGRYEAGTLSALGRQIIYNVELLPDRIDGHRMFKVWTSMDRMWLAEPRLETIIGKRL